MSVLADMWTRAEAVEISPQQRQELMRLAQGRNVAQKIALRARIILGASEGRANRRLAQELGISRPTILLWRKRFEQAGVEGLLRDGSRPGRRKKMSAERVATIVEATLKTRPRDATHWSVRTMAKAQRVSPAMVHRIWQAHGLKPHRVESFKIQYRS
jgi:transposase